MRNSPSSSLSPGGHACELRTELGGTAISCWRLAMAATALLAACSSGGDPANPDEKVDLTFWTWVPNIDKVVAKWNAANPNIQVTASNQAQGDELVTKLLTAAQGGQPAGPGPGRVPGAADAGQQRRARRHRRRRRRRRARATSPTASGRPVTLGTDAVYAVPQDVGPMMLYYRADQFTRLGLTVPKTWDEFAAARPHGAAEEPEPVPDHVLRGRPRLVRRAVPAGRRQLVGRQRRHLEGRVNDAATKKVADYWGGLVSRGRRRRPADVHPGVEHGPQRRHAASPGRARSGHRACCPATPPTRKGKWTIAPLPQWSAGENQHRQLGRLVAPRSRPGPSTGPRRRSSPSWLNTDPEATAILVTRGRRSTRRPRPRRPARRWPQPPAFFSNQPDFYQLAERDREHRGRLHLRPQRERDLQRLQGRLRQGDHRTRRRSPRAVDEMQTATVDDMKK